MTEPGRFIVVDIGKTLSKATLWTRAGKMIDRQVRPNAPCVQDGLRCLDAQGIGDWLRTTLRRWAGQPIEAIVPVAHGAGFAALGRVDGVERLLLPPLDYEQAIPADVLADYRAARDPFEATGSPALPDGLNLGAQIHWMGRRHRREMESAILLPWAQYWAWFLTGRARSEVTSLGCHSDLWSPAEGGFSPMARRLGWADRFAPLAGAADIVGPLRPAIAAETGLPATTQVLAGLHDSNAALVAARGFAEIDRQEATILSTGTWFVAMRLAAESVPIATLPEARDTLVNVDAYGRPVPSARFMGGREIETVIELDTRRVDIKPDQPKLLDAVPALLERGTMMLPTLAPGCGPFPDGRAGWIEAPTDGADGWHARRAGMCLYAALVADTALDLVGSRDRLLIEGRFAEAEVFVRALAALRPDTQIFVANAHNDVSFGALRLIDPRLGAGGGLRRIDPLDGNLSGYRARWHDAVRRATA